VRTVADIIARCTLIPEVVPLSTDAVARLMINSSHFLYCLVTCVRRMLVIVYRSNVDFVIDWSRLCRGDSHGAKSSFQNIYTLV